MHYLAKRRGIALLAAMSTIIASVSGVSASDGYTETTSAGTVGNSVVTLTVNSGSGGTPDPDPNPDPPTPDPTLFSAFVPSTLPITMDADGVVTTPTNARIINGVTTKGIKVTDISVSMGGGWGAASWDDDFSAKADDTKELGLKLRSDSLQADGSFNITASDWLIPKGSYTDLNMGAKLPKQTALGDQGQIATVSFTLDWSGDDTTTGPSVPSTQHTVTYTSDANGSVTGAATASVDDGAMLSFPATTPSTGYVFDKWVNADTDIEVTTSTPVTADMTVKAIFKTETADQLTVTFVPTENGTLEGTTSVSVPAGSTVPVFPTPKPMSARYTFAQWKDAGTDAEVTTTTPITSDTTIKAVFGAAPESAENWFTTDGAHSITGLSSTYLNLVDAPTSLVIPKTIGGSTITRIGEGAFKDKDLITSVVIPDTVTVIYVDAFSGCTSLTELNLDFSAPYHIAGSPFGLDESKIIWGTETESWDTNPMSRKQVTALGLTFLGGELYQTTNAVNTAYGDTLNIPSSIDGTPVTTIGSEKSTGEKAIKSDGTLKTINIPSTVTKIQPGAFYNAKVTTVNLPDGLEFIGANAFGNNDKLTISVPDSVTFIGLQAFNYVKSLELGTFVENDNYGSWYYNAKEIKVREGVTKIGKDIFASCTTESFVLPSSLTEIGEYAFGGCGKLTDLVVPDGVTTIGPKAFSGVAHVTYHGPASDPEYNWWAKALN